MRRRSSLLVLLHGGLAASLAACFAKDPCGAGLREREDGLCSPITAAFTTSPGDAGDGGDAAVAPSFGKLCTAMADCEAAAPICGAPQLPYCTQIGCHPGEPNAGACPAGWSCIDGPGTSVCVKD